MTLCITDGAPRAGSDPAGPVASAAREADRAVPLRQAPGAGPRGGAGAPTDGAAPDGVGAPGEEVTPDGPSAPGDVGEPAGGSLPAGAARTGRAVPPAATGGGPAHRVGPRPLPGAVSLAADGSYAARLRQDAGSGAWFPERWTLDGPEPYAVSLRQGQPEEPDSSLVPLADGRVLVCRVVAGHRRFVLLYPTGPGTGEVALGALPAEAGDPVLLLPCPDGLRVHAVTTDGRDSTVWEVCDGLSGPRRVAQVPGVCEGGVWLDREGRLLALNQRCAGRTKAVALDVPAGTAGPLLELTAESEDRLLLADPDSGLLLLRSDAPGQERLGWGVLGGTRPVRFPECLAPADGVRLTPFASQPGRVLAPEGCAVAFRVETTGAGGSGLAVWRPEWRRLLRLPAPRGWLAGTGLWTPQGDLRLPCTGPQQPCAVATLAVPHLAPEAPGPRAASTAPSARPRGTQGGPATGSAPGTVHPAAGAGTGAGGAWAETAPSGARRPTAQAGPVPGQAGPAAEEGGAEGRPGAPAAVAAGRPVPLQQSPLAALRRRNQRPDHRPPAAVAASAGPVRATPAPPAPAATAPPAPAVAPGATSPAAEPPMTAPPSAAPPAPRGRTPRMPSPTPSAAAPARPTTGPPVARPAAGLPAAPRLPPVGPPPAARAGLGVLGAAPFPSHVSPTSFAGTLVPAGMPSRGIAVAPAGSRTVGMRGPRDPGDRTHSVRVQVPVGRRRLGGAV
ncbi:hypothetical protein ACFV3R_15305 [Streptomyces sp. NPDC059740]|uniref:hypothetical protein n=1 Tax=Streptomyces sp. NPDC059740 TaxID=3346926 RepID=UPI0036588A56